MEDLFCFKGVIKLFRNYIESDEFFYLCGGIYLFEGLFMVISFFLKDKVW